MDEQLKALLEGINALKSGQDMQKSQEETKEKMENMQKSQEETKNELKNRMEKNLENVHKCQEDLRNTLEKIDSMEEKIALKVEEKVAIVEEKVAIVVPVSTSPVPVTASTVSVKLSTYDGKTNWEVHKTQFLTISQANGWTEGVKACQLAASLRGEAAEILQTLPDTERLNLNSLYNALDLRFSQKYSKDYACLQMKTRLQKTGESLQEYASEVERLANLAFTDYPPTVQEAISLQSFVDGLKDGEIQKAVRMADVQDLKSALLYALKLEAATQASRRDRQSIRRARVTADEPCESRLLKEMEKLKEEMKTIKAGISNQEKRNFKCWGCGGTRHLRRNCSRARKEENTVSSSKQEN
ncbi:uncharacterized protein TNCV_1439081 [Trichonephila clavipes]|nr:uncharacterized protein TNCV_1439081 [Trichonephila clavipes]